MVYDARPDDLREHRQSSPATKDRRRWCGGKAGRSHNIEVAIPPNIWTADDQCGLRTRYGRGAVVLGTYWRCVHVYRCSTCGKVLDRLPTPQCPTRPKVATS